MTDLRKLLTDARLIIDASHYRQEENCFACEVVSRIDAALAEKVEPVAEVHVIFDGPPSHESGRFVECENADGKSINAGRWEQRGRYWHLIINAAPADQWRRVDDVVTVDKTAWDNFVSEYDRYNEGDLKMPFSELRHSLAIVIESAKPIPALPEGE